MSQPTAQSETDATLPDERTNDAHLKTIHSWWRDLHGHPAGAIDGAATAGEAAQSTRTRRSPNRRGDRAELARCRTPGDVAFTPAFHRLRQQLVQGREWRGLSDEMLAVLAAVLAHVRADDRSTEAHGRPSFAAQLASGEGKARMSGLRFRRLLAVSTPEDAMARLIDAVRLCDGKASVESLARDVPWLLHRDERTKKAWALAYYSTASTES